VTMRDLLFNEHGARLGDVMMKDPFHLSPELRVSDAMKLTLNRHYPVYPVCDAERRLVGLIRGAALFELEAFEITAQPGAMVGVEKEERVATPLAQSFKFRNPWLLINLVTAFAAGGVVAVFQGTVDRLVILATFLPVLAGQSGNTGCQALAVTVRGITLGDIKTGRGAFLVMKEMWLGLANGAVTGILCGIAMYLLALSQESPHACHARVVGDLRHPRVAIAVHVEMHDVCLLLLRLGHHRPELVDPERRAVRPAADLPEEHRPARPELDAERNGGEQRREEQQPQGRGHQVERALEHAR